MGSHQSARDDEVVGDAEDCSGGRGWRTSPTFGERYPWLTQLGNQPIDALGFGREEPLPTRLLTALHRGGILTCADLAESDERDILDVRHAGPGTLGTLYRTLEMAAASLVESKQYRESSAAWAVSTKHKAAWEVIRAAAAETDSLSAIREPLGVLATWAQFCGEQNTLGGIFDSVNQEHVPEEVRAAFAVVRAHSLPAPPTTPRPGLTEWLASLEPREREIVRHRIAWQDRTLDELGLVHGVTRERIRQLEMSLRGDLGRIPELDDGRDVRWTVDRLRADVGSWATVAKLPGAQPDDEAWRLATVLANLVLDRDDLTIHRRGAVLPSESDLKFIEPEGVLLDEEHARAALSDRGVREAHQDDALEALGLRNVDGIWVRWPRSFVERSIALLALRGEPMSADDLAALAGSTSVRSVRQRLQDDPRVQRATRDTLGLRSWAIPEYTGVADLMLKVIAERGGSLPVDELVAHLERTYQVKPATALAYTAAPAFVLEAGMVRARGRSEPYPVSLDVSRVTDVSLNDDGRAQYDIEVDGELLRGSGRAAPAALGGLMGLQPGRTLDFATGHAEQPSVVMTWSRTSHVGPHLGSLRALALHFGAVQGDRLRLIFDPSSLTAEAELLPRGRRLHS